MGLLPEQFWRLTPGEFRDLAEGWRYRHAMMASLVTGKSPEEMMRPEGSPFDAEDEDQWAVIQQKIERQRKQE